MYQDRISEKITLTSLRPESESAIQLIATMITKSNSVFFNFNLFLGCEDFLSGLLRSNPNEVDDVSVVSPEALLVGSQVTIYGNGGHLNRAVSWLCNKCLVCKQTTTETLTVTQLM